MSEISVVGILSRPAALSAHERGLSDELVWLPPIVDVSDEGDLSWRTYVGGLESEIAEPIENAVLTLMVM